MGGGGSSGGAGQIQCAVKCACKSAFMRALAVVKDPKNVWNEIKGESPSISDLYTKYILIMAAVPAIGQLIHGIYNNVTITI